MVCWINCNISLAIKVPIRWELATTDWGCLWGQLWTEAKVWLSYSLEYTGTGDGGGWVVGWN